MKTSSLPRPVPAHLLREIAVRATCDPRSVAKVIGGLRVRPMVGDRIRRELAAAGIALPVSETP